MVKIIVFCALVGAAVQTLESVELKQSDSGTSVQG